MVRRRKFRPKITVDTSRTNGQDLYFPGCGKQVPKETYISDDTDSQSSPLMDDDEDVPVDSIVLTRTGYVDDVVTPYMPKLPESCWACTHNVEKSGTKTPSPPPVPLRATRRVSFSDENFVPLTNMIPHVEYIPVESMGRTHHM